ncbi:MAG: PQQ-binding-like beta-propeller repeat protein [Planctomycetes bacterium]|nr:PQQ-binding-like beta-propeller repeat protein [Planctomycetota bacterium]
MPPIQSPLRRILLRALGCALTVAAVAQTQTPTPWLELAGGDGPGAGTHIVFVTGDEEYRSEESMPQLARILARLGCRCTVLFAIDPRTHAIDPNVQDHIPGLHHLDRADLLVMFTRFRNLPDDAMQHLADYVESGRPVVGLRTATHAFQIPAERRFAHWTWRSKTWDGGFGRQILGETWIAHHGHHGVEGTLGVLADGAADHPILRGIAAGSIHDPADVYTVRLPLPGDCQPLVLGQVLAGLDAGSGKAPAADGKDRNDPMMPIAWTRTRQQNERDQRVFTTTLGAAQAFASSGTRRLLVNACLWAMGRENAISAELDVSTIGVFMPSPFGFGKHRAGATPADLQAAARVGHRVLLGAHGRLVRLAADGAIEWQMPWGGIHDLHVRDNGHILVQQDLRRVVEIDPVTQRIVWQYDAATGHGNAGRRVEVHAFQPLLEDTMLIAESGPARLLQIARDGTVQANVPLTVRNPDPHRDTRLVRRLPTGNWLVCHEGDGAVREYDDAGKVVWQFEVPLFGKDRRSGHGPEAFGNQVFAAVRLPDGHTLVTTGNGHSLLTVAADGTIVDAIHQDDLAGVRLAWVTTIEVLKNGNYVLGNCHAGPGQPVLVEFEPKSRRVVWTLDGHERFGDSVSNSLVLEEGTLR